MLESIYHMTLKLIEIVFRHENVNILSASTQRFKGRISGKVKKSVNHYYCIKRPCRMLLTAIF